MKEGVISTPDGVYLIQNAPHRDEAVEFLNFVTGYDAQYMITAQLNRRSVRVDVPATDKLPAKDTLPMLQPDSAEIESHRNDGWRSSTRYGRSVPMNKKTTTFQENIRNTFISMPLFHP